MALNLDGNEISCLPDNQNICDSIEEINLSNNTFTDLQIIAFSYINDEKKTEYGAAIDLGLSEEQISTTVNNYKSTPDQAKLEIIKDFVDQQFGKKSSIKFIKQELTKLKSLLKKSDRTTSKGLAKLISFYMNDKSSQGFTAIAKRYVDTPSPKPLKRTKRI